MKGEHLGAVKQAVLNEGLAVGVAVSCFYERYGGLQ